MDNNFTEQENIAHVEEQQETLNQGNLGNQSITKKMSKSKKIAYMALFTALVIILQCISTIVGKVFLVTPPTLAFVPILLAIVVFGIWEGVYLGGVFSLVVLIFGLTGYDAFTYGMIQYMPLVTILLIFVKGMVAPLVACFVYNLLKKAMPKVAIWIASALLPIVNTGVFCLGAFLFKSHLYAIGLQGNIFAIIFLTLAGTNFLIEFIVNVVVTPAVIVVKRVFDKGLI